MAVKTITLKKHEDKRITEGHLWVFSNEIATIEGAPGAGDIVKVRMHGGKPLGTGFYNPHSLIACRIVAAPDDGIEIDFEFFRRRISAALDLRRKIYPAAETFRLVHGEADFLPGLVIDKFNEFVTIQTFSAGMDSRATLICDVLDSLVKPAGIVERNESPLRALEGLELRSGVVRGTVSTTVVSENGIRFEVDPAGGQKTGFFLDQRENRKAFRRYAKGAAVLDGFCNDGGFALNAAHAGATAVTGVDVSADTVARAQANAALNAMSGAVKFVKMDAFEFLRAAAREGRKYDAVNLDPPSFAKNRKSVPAAKKGYAEINAMAMRLLPAGGILATSSCSHHIQDETFLEILKRAAKDAGRRVRLLEWRGAAPDHPVNPSMPETKYLKFAVLSVE
jgi:23S rRNA (cytosine1962-C5)-methyltransferase